MSDYEGTNVGIEPKTGDEVAEHSWTVKVHAHVKVQGNDKAAFGDWLRTYHDVSSVDNVKGLTWDVVGPTDAVSLGTAADRFWHDLIPEI